MKGGGAASTIPIPGAPSPSLDHRHRLLCCRWWQAALARLGHLLPLQHPRISQHDLQPSPFQPLPRRSQPPPASPHTPRGFLLWQPRADHLPSTSGPNAFPAPMFTTRKQDAWLVFVFWLSPPTPHPAFFFNTRAVYLKNMTFNFNNTNLAGYFVRKSVELDETKSINVQTLRWLQEGDQVPGPGAHICHRCCPRYSGNGSPPCRPFAPGCNGKATGAAQR